MVDATYDEFDEDDDAAADEAVDDAAASGGDRLAAFSASRLSERRRRRAQGGSRRAYTWLVKFLRVALPAAAIVAIGAIAYWPQISPEPVVVPPQEVVEMVAPEPEAPTTDLQPMMEQTRYSGVTDDDRPYTITADRAIQSSSVDGAWVVDLVNPLAETVMDDGTWVALRSDEGHYDESASKLLLTGDVRLFHDTGNEFVTLQAHVDFAENLVWGDQPIIGTGPDQTIDADGFRLIDGGRTVVFTGPARLVLSGDDVATSEVLQ